jgi:metallo-beta-lactamase class B
MPKIASALVVALLAAAPQTLTPDNQPADPFKIADNLYYVGSSDIASYLITTLDGHLLIDGGYPETAALIRANVGKLGFEMRDIKILLNTQAHFDHAGGFAELKRLTGARMMASEQDARILESGGHGDFYFGDSALFPAVTVDRRLTNGDQVRLGSTVLTAHLTPGHTKGCTTWTWDARDRGRPYHVVVLCGLTILEGTNVNGMATYPEIKRDYQRTYEILKALPCDIFLGAHASYYGGMKKAAEMRSHPDGPNPFIDSDGYRAYVDGAEKRFRDHLNQR